MGFLKHFFLLSDVWNNNEQKTEESLSQQTDWVSFDEALASGFNTDFTAGKINILDHKAWFNSSMVFRHEARCDIQL